MALIHQYEKIDGGIFYGSERCGRNSSQLYLNSSLSLKVEGDRVALPIYCRRGTGYRLVCQRGSRSLTALNLFKENGFKHVYSLAGGVENCVDFPVLQSGSKA